MQIEQIDRDAAADLLASITRTNWGLADDIRLGMCETHPTVQAFAKHRLTALSARPDDSAVERVIAAVEATGLLAGDEARDVARAAIAALGDSGSL